MGPTGSENSAGKFLESQATLYGERVGGLTHAAGAGEKFMEKKKSQKKKKVGRYQRRSDSQSWPGSHEASAAFHSAGLTLSQVRPFVSIPASVFNAR